MLAPAGAAAAVAGATAAAHRATVAAGKQLAVDAALPEASPAWPGPGMPPEDAPLAAATLRGQQADAALAAALLAA